MARRGKKIESVRWTGDVLASGTALATGGSDAVELYQVGDQEAAPTILRTHLNFAIWAVSIQVPNRGCHWAMGIHVVPKGTGTTVLISPLTESEADWFVHRTGVLGYEEPVADVIDVPGMTAQRLEVDSKAMRKLKPGEELQIVVAQLTISGITAMNVNWACQPRLLLGT